MTAGFIFWCVLGLLGAALMCNLIFVALKGLAEALDQDQMGLRYILTASFFNIINCVWLLFWVSRAITCLGVS